MSTITIKKSVRNSRYIGWNVDSGTNNSYWVDHPNAKPKSWCALEKDNNDKVCYQYAYFDFDTSTIPRQVENLKLYLEFESRTESINRGLFVVDGNITSTVATNEYFPQTLLHTLAPPSGNGGTTYIMELTRNQTVLSVGYLVPEVITAYENGILTASIDELEKTTHIEYDITECNLSNLTCTQNNIDSDLMFTWDSDYQTSVEIKIYKGSALKATKTVTTAKTVTFYEGTIRESGEYTVKLNGCDGETIQETFTLVKTVPTVGSLEPNGLSKDGRETIDISWVSTNQTSYICNVGGHTYTGTTATNITLPANSLEYGTNTIHLTIRYAVAWGGYREATTSATFTVYGPPTQPTMTSSSIFSTGTPRFTWTSTGQTAYKLTIKQGIAVIFTTGEVINTNKYYVSTTALENSEEYQVYLQIKNKYNIWSEETVQNIAIQFAIPPKPSLNAFLGDNAIVLNIVNTTAITNYKYSEIYRKDTLNDEFIRIALNLPENGAYYDYFVAHGIEYEYFVRNYNQAGGYNDSDSVIISANVQGYELYDIEDSNKRVAFYNDVEITDDFKRDVELFNMATSKAPYSERGINDYLTCKVSYKTSKLTDFHSLQKLEKTSKVLMYKDKQGRKMPCNITSNISRSVDKFGFITVGFTLTEVQFEECDYINGGNEGRELLIWNGTWKFDGTHSFGGE